jgi:hypothetical protein
MMGVELEVEAPTNSNVLLDIDCAIESGTFPAVVSESDSSLNYGIEIISHPMDIQGHYRVWPDILKLLRKKKMQGDLAETAGLHVTFESIPLTARANQILKEHQGLICLIAGREYSVYCSWSRIYQEHVSIYKESVLADRNHKPILDQSHSVYEFRPSRSSVKDQKFFARLEMAQAFQEWAIREEPVKEWPEHMRTYENLGAEMRRLGV